MRTKQNDHKIRNESGEKRQRRGSKQTNQKENNAAPES